MREIAKYAIFYSVATCKEDLDYIEDIEKRMKKKDYVPTQKDKGYVVALDKDGKIIYEFNS